MSDFPTAQFQIKGNAPALSSIASSFSTVAGIAAQAGATVGRTTIADWQGSEGDAYRTKLPPLKGSLQSAAGAYRSGGRTIGQFSSTLESAQNRMTHLADEARPVWFRLQTAKSAQADLNRQHVDPVKDPVGAAKWATAEAKSAVVTSAAEIEWASYVARAEALKLEVEVAATKCTWELRAQTPGDPASQILADITGPPTPSPGPSPRPPTPEETEESDDFDPLDWLWGNVKNGAGWVWDHVGVPVVNTGATILNAAANHPEDLVSMAAGAALMVLGGSIDGGGGALALTGVGIIVTIPAEAVGSAIIATGGTLVVAGGGDLLMNAAKDPQEVVTPSAKPQARPGDPVDTSAGLRSGSSSGGRTIDFDPKVDGTQKIHIK